MAFWTEERIERFQSPGSEQGSTTWQKAGQVATGLKDFALNLFKIKTQAQYGQQYPVSTGPSLTTILLIGGAVIGGIYLLKKRR